MEQTFNGVEKPAAAIVRGPHVYVEAEHKYKEQPSVYREFPRAMYSESGGYREVQNVGEMVELEAQGWRKTAFPPKAPQENIKAPSADLALIVLQQQQLLEQQGKQIAQLMADVKAPEAIPEVPRKRQKNEPEAKHEDWK